MIAHSLRLLSALVVFSCATGNQTLRVSETPREVPNWHANLLAHLQAPRSPAGALATDVGDEVELYSAALTALDCAVRARDHHDLSALAACPPGEAATSGFAVFDLAERKAYRVAGGGVLRHELESGFGGSIDVTGHIIGREGGVPVLAFETYQISPRARPGSFKGCL